MVGGCLRQADPVRPRTIGPKRRLHASGSLYNSLCHSLAAADRSADGNCDVLRDICGGNQERLFRGEA